MSPRHSAPTRPSHAAGMPAKLRKPVPVFKIVVIAIIAVILIAAGMFFARCSQSRLTVSGSSEPAYTSPYDWNNLTKKNQLYSYSTGGAVQSRIGIDVSDHQGDIDWQAVADDGIQFAYIRLGYRGTTEGGIFPDANYEANMAGAKAAGLDRGVYFYSQATTEAEAEEEADYVVQTLGGAKLEYPVAFDAEPTTGTSRISSLSKDQLTKNAIAFCNRLQQNGYSAIIYGNNQDMSRFDKSQLTSWPIWYAEYGNLPSAQFDFTMWQYANGGNISGISTTVDLDIDLTTAYKAAKQG